MLRQSQRVSKRINFKILNSTGDKVYIDSEEINQSVMAEERLRTFKAQTHALIDDIKDFVEENAIADIKFCVADIDTAINRIEDLRSTFREKIGRVKAQMTVEDFSKLIS